MSFENPNGRCPRCTGPLHQAGLHPALSRFDNMTQVCSSCGADEALYQSLWGECPGFDYLLIGGNKQQKGV